MRGPSGHLTSVPTEFHPRLNLIAGDNGQGKDQSPGSHSSGLRPLSTATREWLPAEGSSEATVSAKIGPSVSEDDGSGKHQGTLGCAITGSASRCTGTETRSLRLPPGASFPPYFSGGGSGTPGGSPDVRRKAHRPHCLCARSVSSANPSALRESPLLQDSSPHCKTGASIPTRCRSTNRPSPNRGPAYSSGARKRSNTFPRGSRRRRDG